MHVKNALGTFFFLLVTIFQNQGNKRYNHHARHGGELCPVEFLEEGPLLLETTRTNPLSYKESWSTMLTHRAPEPKTVRHEMEWIGLADYALQLRHK
ncbi:hypothetical protein V8B97DRAFT_1970901 [Scleroderma yunnanense]